MAATGIDWDDEDNFDITLSGTVADLISDVSFTINGVLVLITTTTEFDESLARNLVNGILVEVEGQLDANQNLIASEIGRKCRVRRTCPPQTVK